MKYSTTVDDITADLNALKLKIAKCNAKRRVQSFLQDSKPKNYLRMPTKYDLNYGTGPFSLGTNTYTPSRYLSSLKYTSPKLTKPIKTYNLYDDNDDKVYQSLNDNYIKRKQASDNDIPYLDDYYPSYYSKYYWNRPYYYDLPEDSWSNVYNRFMYKPSQYYKYPQYSSYNKYYDPIYDYYGAYKSPSDYDPYLPSAMAPLTWKQYYYTQKLRSKPSRGNYWKKSYDPYDQFFRVPASTDSPDDELPPPPTPPPPDLLDDEEFDRGDAGYDGGPGDPHELIDTFIDAIYEEIIKEIRKKQCRRSLRRQKKPNGPQKPVNADTTEQQSSEKPSVTEPAAPLSNYNSSKSKSYTELPIRKTSVEYYPYKSSLSFSTEPLTSYKLSDSKENQNYTKPSYDYGRQITETKNYGQKKEDALNKLYNKESLEKENLNNKMGDDYNMNSKSADDYNEFGPRSWDESSKRRNTMRREKDDALARLYSRDSESKIDVSSDKPKLYNRGSININNDNEEYEDKERDDVFKKIYSPGSDPKSFENSGNRDPNNDYIQGNSNNNVPIKYYSRDNSLTSLDTNGTKAAVEMSDELINHRYGKPIKEDDNGILATVPDDFSFTKQEKSSLDQPFSTQSKENTIQQRSRPSSSTGSPSKLNFTGTLRKSSLYASKPTMNDDELCWKNSVAFPESQQITPKIERRPSLPRRLSIDQWRQENNSMKQMDDIIEVPISSLNSNEILSSKMPSDNDNTPLNNNQPYESSNSIKEKEDEKNIGDNEIDISSNLGVYEKEKSANDNELFDATNIESKINYAENENTDSSIHKSFLPKQNSNNSFSSQLDNDATSNDLPSLPPAFTRRLSQMSNIEVENKSNFDDITDANVESMESNHIEELPLNLEEPEASLISNPVENLEDEKIETSKSSPSAPLSPTKKNMEDFPTIEEKELDGPSSPIKQRANRKSVDSDSKSSLMSRRSSRVTPQTSFSSEERRGTRATPGSTNEVQKRLSKGKLGEVSRLRRTPSTVMKNKAPSTTKKA